VTSRAEQAFDAAVKHRIGLNRYSSWLVRRVISQLNRVEKDIISRLAEAAPDSVAGGRLELLLDAIRVLQAQGWVTIKARLTEDLTDLAEAEALFSDRLTKLAARPEAFTVFSPAPPVGQVMAAVQARPFQGRFLKGWLDDAEEGEAKRVRETIRQGFIEGRPTAEIVRTLRGTRANKYRDGVLEISRRGAEAMVRTAITHTANVAHEEAYQANSDIVRGVEWVSVLDSRTTMICASRDGKIYPIGKGPRPPAHIGCRSTTIPVVDKIEGVAEFNRPTYPEWLAKQSAAAQDDILGPARGRLFRSGGLKVESFVDRKGSLLTLQQLRERDAEAFQRAGLTP